MSRKTESFDLSTAMSFLPVMDDTEDGTRQLISSIKMYNSLLDEKSKPVLLNFIINSRLSPSAKVRLSKNYKSVDHLVNDMNKFLIPKKSFTVIQQQLLHCVQNKKNIDAYGREIEKLFVDLTIAQANGDQNSQRVLRPINEKTAIHRFTTGLDDAELRTIVIAKNYRSLKDAIQGAKDEQASMSLNSKNVKYENKQFSNNNASCSRGRGRGGHNNQPNQQGRGFNHSTGHNYQGGTGKSFDNRDGNNQCQRGQGHSARGNSRGTHHNDGNHSATHNHRNASGGGNNHSQRGHGQSSRGNSRGTHHNQGASGKSYDNRDGQHHSRGSSRGNTRGSNQPGSYHNQGNRGQNNNAARPAVSVAFPEFQVDCQFRFSASSGNVNVNSSNPKNASAPKNKQVVKKQ